MPPRDDEPKAEESKRAEQAEEPRAKAQAAPSGLARAAETSDAGVQFLLANRQAALANGDSAKVESIDAELAELGFSAS